MLAVAVALTVAVVGTGCGTKNDDTVATQKETTVSTKDTEDKKDTKEIAKESTDKQEETQQQETAVNTEQEVVAQQTVAADNSVADTKASSNNEANNANTASRPSTNTTATTENGHTNTNTGSRPASNANNSGGNTSVNPTPTPTPAPTQHQHTWVHVDATGHYETVVVQAAWDEQIPVYGNVEHSICNTCGADITGHSIEHLENSLECGGYHSVWKYEQTGTQTIHHDAVTEQRWVQDTPAYDVCSGCGATK